MELRKYIRTLIVEDAEDDALLVARELRKGGFDPDFLRVDAADALRQALTSRTWDVILSDYRMPGFSGADALKIAKALSPDVPFIIISGTIGEELAVAMMKAGADDYLLKDALGKLTATVERELRDADMRRERRAQQEALRRSEEYVRNILDTVDEGFIVIDREYRILAANKAYCAQVRLPVDSVIGRHCYEVSHKLAKPCFEAGEECVVKRVFETSEPQIVVHNHTDGDGAVIFVETKAYPLRNDAGEVTSVIQTVSNITEKHLLEEERLKTQKLEAIGTLAGGIAHDFNNLLQGVFGYISMAKMTIDQKERSLAMLEQAEKALNLSVSLTTQLLTFSKGGKPVRRRIDLGPVIENAVKFALSGSRIDYRIHVDPYLHEIDADEGQIGQVIQNIVLNADQAMPAGGMIEIDAKNVPAHDQGAPQALQHGEFVAISIKDSGIGIPEHFLAKIFDPYFTTKEKGSGLGLATSYSIIRNHDGLIDVRSEIGKGSAFTIYLPALEARAPEDKTLLASTSEVGARRILVMDDEEIVRMVARELIATLGHQVDVAEHGAAAVDKYRQARESGRPYDIVILDLTIRGGMGGLETLRRLREIDPEVKAAVSSGYSDEAAAAEYEAHGFRAFLKKPYDIDALKRMLNTLLQ